MSAYGINKSKLHLLIERAVKAGLRISNLEYKDRDKGTAEARFLFHCSAVVNTARNTLNVWRAIANRHQIPARFMDPLLQNALESDEQVSELTENDLAEVFDAAASVDGTKLTQLAKLVDRYVTLESEATALEEQAGTRSKELWKLRTVDLPELMRQARILTQDMDSGHRVTLGTAVAGGWPKDEVKRAAALKALAKIGSEDLVKQTMTLSFLPDDHKTATEVLKYLKRKKVQVEVDRTVNTMTYRAWAKEMLADQQTAPIILSLLNELGLMVMDQATVKQVKKKRA